MSNQLLDLAFFQLLCTCYNILNKQVEDHYKPGDLVDQVNQYSYVWSQYENRIANLRLVISEYSLGLINSFNIAGTLR